MFTYSNLNPGVTLWEINSYQRKGNEREEESNLEPIDWGSNGTRQLDGRQKSQTKSSRRKVQMGRKKEVMMAHFMSASVTETTWKFGERHCHGNRFLYC